MNRFTLILILFFGYFLSLIYNSHYLNFLGLCSVFFISFILLKKKGGWVFFLYSFGLAFALFSSYLTEVTGVFLLEVREYGYLTGGTARNSFLASLFLLFAYAAYMFFLRIMPSMFYPIKKLDSFSHKIFIFISFAALVYIAFVLLKYGSPLFLGVDRFTYNTYYAPFGYTWVYGNIPFLAILMALASFKGLVSKRVSLIWLFLAVFLFVYAGEKMSKLVLLFFFYLLPYFIYSNIQRKHFVSISLFFSLISILVFFNYFLIYGSAEILIPRLALQGQMNFSLDRVVSDTASLNLLKNFFGFNSADYEKGLPYLMYIAAPYEVANYRLEHGATFTVPFPANISYFFGRYVSPFVVIIFSTILGFSSALVYKSIRSSNIILVTLSIKIFITVYVVIMMGEVYYLFSVKFLLYMVVFILYVLFVLLKDLRRV